MIAATATTIVATGIAASTAALGMSIKVTRSSFRDSLAGREYSSWSVSDVGSAKSMSAAGSGAVACSSCELDLPAHDDASIRKPPQFSACGLLCSPFVVTQVVFNVVASFGGPLLCFYLMFASGGPYPWLSGEVLGPIIASPIAGCVCSLAFAPLSMPEMTAKGWFGIVLPADVRRISYVFPFLGRAKAWRIGVVRHLMLALLLAVVVIPPALVLVSPLVFGPDLGAWTFIWLAIAYISVLPIVIIPLGLLGFAIEPNYARVQALMSNDSRPMRRLLLRAMRAPQC